MLVVANQNKGSRVELNMVKKWKKDDVIGYNMAEDNGRIYANLVLCKVSACNKDSLLMHPN